MKRRKRNFDRDFVKSEVLTNAMDTTAEFHRAKAPKRPNHRDFHQRNYRRLNGILSKNKAMYKKMIRYKSEYSKEKTEESYIP